MIVLLPITNQTTCGKPLKNGKTLYLNIFIVCTIYFRNNAYLDVKMFILGSYGNAYKSGGTKGILKLQTPEISSGRRHSASALFDCSKPVR